jgi:hypothetical protein
MIAQRLTSLYNRAVRQPDGDTADIDALPAKVSRASKYLAFDAAGDPIATAGTTEENPVSAFVATLLDDANAGAFFTTLGISAFIQTLLDDANAAAARTTLGVTLATLGTAVATTSGTAHDFVIPAGTRRVTVPFRGVSLSGTDNLLVQIGTGGAPTTTGYVSTSNQFNASGASTGASSTAGFIISAAGSSAVVSGLLILVLLDEASNTWAASFSGKNLSTVCVVGGGDVALAGELDFLRVTRTGTDTFAAGSVNAWSMP